MARTDPQINIRVPAELKKKLELLAVENSRSLNAEVVTRLEQSLCENTPTHQTATLEVEMDIKEIKEILKRLDNKKAP